MMPAMWIAGRAARRAETRRLQSGQALVELALMLPFLLLLVIGVIEIGRYAYIGTLVGDAAHAGAIYGAQSLAQSVDTNGIRLAVLNDFHDNAQDTKNLTLTVDPPSVSCGCDSAGKVTTAACTGTGAGTCAKGSHWVVTLSVTTTGNFKAMFKYPGIPTSITLSRTSTLRVGNVG
jgi:Flp pilus assembly protein TadG